MSEKESKDPNPISHINDDISQLSRKLENYLTKKAEVTEQVLEASYPQNTDDHRDSRKVTCEFIKQDIKRQKEQLDIMKVTLDSIQERIKLPPLCEYG